MINFFKIGIINSLVFMYSKFLMTVIAMKGSSNETIPLLGEQVFRWLPYLGVVLLCAIVYLLYRRNKKNR